MAFDPWLTNNTGREESSQDKHESNGRNNVPEQELRSDGPVKEAYVRRMSGPRVDTMRDERVIIVFVRFNDMGKRLVGVDHGQRPHGLRRDQHDHHCHQLHRDCHSPIDNTGTEQYHELNF